jgi:transglutaminase-like putative cysteine protease
VKFRVLHRTLYRYSTAVKLDRHLVRLLPRSDTRQSLLSSRVEIHPSPARRIDCIDAWGNQASRLWFEGDTRRLELTVRLEVDTQAVADPQKASGETTPLPYPPDYGADHRALRPYMARRSRGRLLTEFVRELETEDSGQLLPLLQRLNRKVHGYYAHDIRLQGMARSPEQTLRKGEGVCRDLAMLFIAACRELGIAARFVSGYQAEPASPRGGARYLHAWPEVYVPQYGWYGYDPTHACAVDERHVAVASAAGPAAVAPIEGSYGYTGSVPRSKLETLITIDVE